MTLKTAILDPNNDRVTNIYRTVNSLFNPLNQFSSPKELLNSLKTESYDLILLSAEGKGINPASVVNKLKRVNNNEDLKFAIYSNKDLNPKKFKVDYSLPFPAEESDWRRTLNEILPSQEEASSENLLEDESEEISVEIMIDDHIEGESVDEIEAIAVEDDEEVSIETSEPKEENALLLEDDNSDEISIKNEEEIELTIETSELETDVIEIKDPAEMSKKAPPAIAGSSRIKIQTLETEISQLRKALAQEKTKSNKLERKNKGLNNELKELSEEISLLTENKIETESKLSTISQQSDQFGAELDKLNEQRLELEDDLKSRKKGSDDLNVQVDKLKANLDEKESELSSKADKFKSLQSEN